MRNLTSTIKYAVAARTIQIYLDIDIAPTKPSDVYIDAQAVLKRAGAERMPKSSRWMGTRYAMVRYAEDSDTVKIRKVRAIRVTPSTQVNARIQVEPRLSPLVPGYIVLLEPAPPL